jgi:hypothetical protein
VGRSRIAEMGYAVGSTGFEGVSEMSSDVMFERVRNITSRTFRAFRVMFPRGRGVADQCGSDLSGLNSHVSLSQRHIPFRLMGYAVGSSRSRVLPVSWGLWREDARPGECDVSRSTA